MKKLNVNEVFYSLQGEGGRAGEASVFVRLAGCDLACGFCDTEFTSGKELSLDELLTQIRDAIARAVPGNHIATPDWIVWTGGEPCLQITEEVVKHFRELGWKQAVETNGNHRPPAGLDWITVSPKVAIHVVEKNFAGVEIAELRCVRHAGQLSVPKLDVLARQRFLSPIFDGSTASAENIRHCIKLCLENPEWRLSLQTHKLTKIL
jgi:7-carboxy-7-deazaguanine synthase